MKKTRKDNNHNQIAAAFKSLLVPFLDLSKVGGGMPDGLIWIKQTWQFVEIKNREWGYGRQGLNQNQLDWLAQFPYAKVYLVESVDDVISLVNDHLRYKKIIMV